MDFLKIYCSFLWELAMKNSLAVFIVCLFIITGCTLDSQTQFARKGDIGVIPIVVPVMKTERKLPSVKIRENICEDLGGHFSCFLSSKENQNQQDLSLLSLLGAAKSYGYEPSEHCKNADSQTQKIVCYKKGANIKEVFVLKQGF